MTGNRQRIAILILSCCVYFLTFSLTSIAQADDSRIVIKIGVIVPLTGGLARRGQDIARFLEIQADRLTEKSKHFRYQLLVDDGKCGLGRDAVSAGTRFIDFEKIKFLITACSGETLLVGPLAEKAQVLLFAVSANHPDVAKLGEYVFRTFVNIERDIRILGKLISKKSNSRVAILSEENSFTLSIKVILSESLGEHLVLAEDFASGSADTATLLLKAKAKGVDSIYLNAASEETLAQLVNNAHKQNVQAQLYSFAFPEIQYFRTATRSNAYDLIFLGNKIFDNTCADYLETRNTFMKRFGVQGSDELLLRATYDALKAMTDGIESVGPVPTMVKDFLKTYSWQGALGKVEFDSAGDIKNVHYVLKQIKKDGSVAVIDELAD